MGLKPVLDVILFQVDDALNTDFNNFQKSFIKTNRERINYEKETDFWGIFSNVCKILT